ncbi:MAG: aminoacyl-tRNA hydrolase [Cellulophaga sp.]|nr:aminoacyl-tRNA hydrolase [Cellulophaga sp.]
MNKEEITQELQFKAVRSSGAGGQHVNKVSTKIELVFNLLNSKSLNDSEKEKITLKLKNRLTKENILLLQCDESRSQFRNKELAIKRFLKLLENALKEPKKRKATKPSKSAIEKRLKGKKKSAEKKANRSKPEW